MEVYKFLPKVRGGAKRAEGSVVEGKLLYYCQKKEMREASPFNNIIKFLQASQDSVMQVKSLRVRPPSSALHFRPR